MLFPEDAYRRRIKIAGHLLNFLASSPGSYDVELAYAVSPAGNNQSGSSCFCRGCHLVAYLKIFTRVSTFA